MGVLFSKKHRNGKYTVQFENGIVDDIPETDLLFHSRLDNLNNDNDIEQKRKDVIRYTLLFEKTINKYGDPVNAHGDTKGVFEYEGKIRFAVFSGRSLNEDVANIIACNKDARQLGKCSHSTKPIILSPVTDRDILIAYNEQAGERAAENSLSSSSQQRSTPRGTPGTHRRSRGGGGRRKTKRKG